MKRVVVVGAGPGGLAAASRLRERGGERVETVLVARGARATFLAGTLDVALGVSEPDRFVAALALEGLKTIDGDAERVARDGVLVAGERIAADAVIAAPGLALAPETLPAWPRAGVAWDPVAAEEARERLLAVEAGRVLIAVCSLPYRCPPAPFALAVGLAGVHAKARHMTRVVVATPERFPLSGVGGEAPALVMEACGLAGVEVEREFQVDMAASEDGVLRSGDGRELSYQAALLIPPHVRAPCLSELPGEGPLVPVGERGAVEGTALHVVGDAADTGLPRAAGFAQAIARAAADGVLERLGVAPAPAPEPAEASCFMFHWGGAVSRLRVRQADEGATVHIDGPSLDLLPAREGERRRFLAAARDAA